jgi:hypothetical protein
MNKEECREQIQEDLRCYFGAWELPLPDDTMDSICQIVVDNFKKLEG